MVMRPGSIRSPRGRGGGEGLSQPREGPPGTVRLGDPIQPLWLPPAVGEGSGLTSSGTQFPPTLS